MPKTIVLQSRVRSFAFVLLGVALVLPLSGQAPSCVPPTNQKLTIYRAGSVTAAFKPLVEAFTCQTGIQVEEKTGSSVGMARQCVNASPACDLYASADYSNIDLFLKPAGYADFNIVFAQGRMVLAYSASSVAEKTLPSIAD